MKRRQSTRRGGIKNSRQNKNCELRGGRVSELEQVEDFRYLGTFFKGTPVIREDIQAKLLAGNICVGAPSRLLTNKIISEKLDVRIYKRLIRLAV